MGQNTKRQFTNRIKHKCENIQKDKIQKYDITHKDKIQIRKNKKVEV